MFNNTFFPNEISLMVPLTSTAHSYAKRFAQEQASREKQRQVYYNTLAVYTMREYLNWMGIETDLEAGDSWNQIARMTSDVADLSVVGFGRLECRPVVGSASVCVVPSETWSDRQAYVVIKLEPPYGEAEIIGFSPTARNGELPLEALQPVEDLCELLSQQPQITISLSQWLGGMVTEGWQELESFFSDPQVAWRGTNQVSGLEPDLTWGKVLNFGVQMGNQSLILLISVKPESALSMLIQIRLQPNESSRYLPSGVILSLLSETGEDLQTVESRRSDNFIQMLPFRGQIREPFRVRVRLEEFTLEEQFVI